MIGVGPATAPIMPGQALHAILARQYRASLGMLSEAICKCTDSLWLSAAYPNRFWHVAYHALFFTHLYLQPSEAWFRPWSKHRRGYQFLGPTPWPPFERPKIESPYTKAELLDFHALCLQDLAERVRDPGLESPSGFSWLQFSRLELHLYNIRHVQHHAGQLIDRLRTVEDLGVNWIAALEP